MKGGTTMSAVVRKIGLLACVMCLVSACSVSASASLGTGRKAGVASATPAFTASLPLPRAIAKRLPAGIFYLLAGTNPASYNLWEVVNTGNEIELTHNSEGYGISAFGASPAGIVMADAANGYDQLARLTANGVSFLKDGSGSTPAINSAGQICYSLSPDGNKQPYFELVLKDSLSATGRVIYRQKADIVSNVWGPGNAIAMVVGGHYPGTTGPTPRLVIQKAGTSRTVATGLGKDLSDVIWGTKAAGLALGTWSGTGRVIYGHGKQYTLPHGWNPAAWNASGTLLLVWGPSKKIGLWSPLRPQAIQVIGTISKGVTIGQSAWLNRPAKL